MSHELDPQINPSTPNVSEAVRDVPQSSEALGKVPQVAEGFGTLPNDAEYFRTVPKPSVRRENCTLIVREAARMFEAAGVARSERSITTWCQPNRQGIPRLEAYFDPNERRYFITPQSVEAVIAEEKAKAAKTTSAQIPQASEEVRTIPNASEENRNSQKGSEAFRKDADPPELVELRKENLDLKITNRAKDYHIEQLKAEREAFVEERRDYVEKLMSFNRQVGELSLLLHQLEAHDTPKRLKVQTEEAEDQNINL